MSKEFGELGNLLNSKIDTTSENDKKTVESFLTNSYAKFGSKYEQSEGKDKEELANVILGKFEAFKNKSG